MKRWLANFVVLHVIAAAAKIDLKGWSEGGLLRGRDVGLSLGISQDDRAHGNLPVQMQVFHPELEQDYVKTIKLAPAPGAVSPEKVIFHTLWDDLSTLSEKNIMSLKSAYLTNVKGQRGRSIILWTYGDVPSNPFVQQAEQYATIKKFVWNEMLTDSPLHDRKEHPAIKRHMEDIASDSSDLARYLLLWRYGGVWFDLDVFFLRSFDPLYAAFPDEAMVYAWEYRPWPNGAIFICLKAQHPHMRSLLNFMLSLNRDHGHGGSSFGFWSNPNDPPPDLSYQSPIPLTVLPCSWFDASWIQNPMGFQFSNFFQGSSSTFNVGNFFPGAFAYHWHNQWAAAIPETSPARQLMESLESSWHGASPGGEAPAPPVLREAPALPALPPAGEMPREEVPPATRTPVLSPSQQAMAYR